MRWSLSMFFFFRQKTAYEMRISDWSSDVCSSDLLGLLACRVQLALQAVTRRFDVGTAVRRCRAQQVFGPGNQFTQATLHSIGRLVGAARSEERSVGKECVRTCRSRGSPHH